MQYRIELAQEQEVTDLLRIESAAASLFSDEDVPPANKAKTTPVGVLEKAQLEERLWVAVEESTGQLVGFAYVTDGENSLHLNEISVCPEHARKGLGTRLMKAVIQRAINTGRISVTLTTFIHLPWNAPFYQNLGFKILRESELGPELKEILIREAAGLDRSKRAVMRLELQI